jgi:hypothetical protein
LVLDPTLQLLLGAWEARCEQGQPPRLGSIAPDELDATLRPFLALVHIVNSGMQLQFQYCGTTLAAAAGMDLTGKLVHRLNPDRPYAAYIEALYDRSQHARRPVYSECTYARSGSSKTLLTRRLICPLRGAADAVAGFIAGQTFSTTGKGAAPTLVHHDHFVPGAISVL